MGQIWARARNKAKSLTCWSVLVVSILTLSALPASADDHNFDMGEGGELGVPTAWDSESVNPLSGNLHLSIPLYSVQVGPGLEMNIALQYNSIAWDSTDSTFLNDWPYFLPPNRHIKGKSPIGMGWSLNIPSIHRILYQTMTGVVLEEMFFYRAEDGGMHRLFRERCRGERFLWFSNDDSGIKAKKIDVPGSEGVWTVWLPDGRRLELNQYFGPLLENQSNALYRESDWFVTTIESATRLNDAAHSPTHWINVEWWDPSTLHPSDPTGPPEGSTPHYTWQCPKRMVDSLGRQVFFACKSGPAPHYAHQDGGSITSISVPGPGTAAYARYRTYELASTYETIADPFTQIPCPIDLTFCPPDIVTQDGILRLNQIKVFDPYTPCEGGECTPTPIQEFSFNYNASGAIREVVLPGGGKRTYDFTYSKSWIRDYPGFFDGPFVSQYGAFPIYGIRSRTLEADGRSWSWQYLRSNEACDALSSVDCWDHPHEVQVTGPLDLLNPSAARSTVVYKYNATKRAGATTAGGSVTPGEVSPLDGTLRSMEVYAGTPSTGRLVRRTNYEYGYTPAVRDECHPRESLRDHYADYVRVNKVTTSYEDDWKPVHDRRVVENLSYSQVVENVWMPQETREYLADGTTLYRKTTRGFLAIESPNDADLPKTEWVRVQQADGTTLSESRAHFNTYGQVDSVRRLYAPGASPGATSPNDVLTTVTYSPTTGFPDQVYVGTGANPQAFGEAYGWTYGSLTSRQSQGVAWKSEDRTVDAATGLVIEERPAWGGGQRYLYDLLGRVVRIEPLAGSSVPVTTIGYSGNQIIRAVGDVQEIDILDGLGRSKEHRKLKLDDGLADQWVAQALALDWAGEVQTISEWAPVGALDVAATRTERYGLVRTSSSDPGITAVDPMRRIYRILRPDGSESKASYQGLVTTRTTFGVQGGTVDAPALFDQVITETSDIFGRGPTITRLADRVTMSIYDEMNQLKEVALTVSGHTQVRRREYDRLGRVTLLEEPERGKIWFGSHNLDAVDPDGYDALGNQVRFQTAAGFAETTRYHYRLTYDQAGRLTLVEKETDQALARTRISEFLFDLSSNGNGASSHLGRLGRSLSYDDLGILVHQTDSFYQDSFGRLDRTVASFGLSVSPTPPPPLTTSYTYDALSSIGSVTYPFLAGGLTPTQVTYGRTHGMIQSVGSNRGPIVTGALYNDTGGLKQWTAFSGVKTLAVPDTTMKARVKEYRVVSGTGSTMWSSGQYSFDGAGNVSRTGTDVYTYDGYGRLSEGLVAGPTGSPLYTQIFQYDAFGNLSSKSLQVDGGMPDGTIFNIDQVKNQVIGLGVQTNWIYRADGALTHDDVFDYGYDNAGRLSQVQVTGNSVGRYAYDAVGKRVYHREDHGKEIFYFRDPEGNLLSQFTRPTGSTSPPQWDRDFVYMEGQRVAMIENAIPGGTPWKVSSSTSSGISLTWYQAPILDSYGYLVLRKGPAEAEFAPLYSGGLAISTTSTTYVDTTATSGVAYQYKVLTIDTAGNQGPSSIARTITRDDSIAPPDCTALTGQAGNGVVTLQWPPFTAPPADLAGYYLYRKIGNGAFGSPLNTYPIFETHYEDLGVVNGTTYKYMVRSVDTAGLTSVVASNVVSLTPTDGPEAKWERRQDEDDGDAVADGSPSPVLGELCPYEMVGQSALPQILYLHTDHLGTLRFVTDYSGNQVAVHKYLPFGDEAQVTQSRSPFRYAGYEFDAEMQRFYVGARYYSPRSSRWATPDPLGDGFRYAGNNPVKYKDPTGLDFRCHEVCVSSTGYPTPAQGKKPPTGSDPAECHWVCVDDGTVDEPRIFQPVDEPDLFPPPMGTRYITVKGEDPVHQFGCAFQDVLMVMAIGGLAEIGEYGIVGSTGTIVTGFAALGTPTGVGQAGGGVAIGVGAVNLALSVGAVYIAYDGLVSMAEGGKGNGLGLNSAGRIYRATGCHQ